MTEIIKNWLEITGIYKQNEGVEKAFANGYLLGKLLNKYNMQKDFNFFKDSNTSSAKISNFSRLEPTFRHLGLKINARDACDIMEEKPGLIFRLLYELFVILEQNRHLSHKYTADVISGLTGDLRTLERTLYVHQLKQLVPRQSEANLSQLTKRFEARRKENSHKADLKNLQAESERSQRVQTNRASLLSRSHELRVAQSDLMAKLEANIIQLPKKRQKQSTESKIVTGGCKTAKEAQQMLADIQEFERLLQLNEFPLEDNRKPATATELVDRLRVMRSSVLSGQDKAKAVFKRLDPSASHSYIARIHERVWEEKMAMEERQKRRRHVIVASLEEIHAHEEEIRAKQQAERLLRQSQLERRINVQLAQTQHEKAVFLANRLQREKEYEAMREAEFQAAMDRERDLALKKKNEEALVLAVLREVWNHQKVKRRQMEYTRHYEFVAHDVVRLIVQFACQVGEYRTLTKRLIPASLFRQWKAQFIAGQPFWVEDKNENNDEEPKEECGTNEDNQEELNNEVLDEWDIETYQNLSGEWDLGEVGTIQTQPYPGAKMCPVYGSPIEWNTTEQRPTEFAISCFDPSQPEYNPVFDWVVNRLRLVVYPPPPPPPYPDLPDLKIRAALLGKPFSGKSTVTKALLKNHRCAVLDPQQLVKEALDAFHTGEKERNILSSKSNDSSVEEPAIVDRPTVRAQLGELIDQELQAGRTVSDELLTNLIFESIKALTPGAGFILEGFPSNLRQAKLLEQRLTVAEPTEATDLSQVPVAKIGGSPDLPLRRGLDIVIFLDVPEDELLKRAASNVVQRQDTGERNTDEPQDLSVSSEFREASNLHERLAGFLDSWPDLEKFYSDELHILKVVSGPLTTPEENTGEVDIKSNKRVAYKKVERLLQRAVEKKEKPESSKPSESPDSGRISLAENEPKEEEQAATETAKTPHESQLKVPEKVEEKLNQQPQSTTSTPVPRPKSAVSTARSTASSKEGGARRKSRAGKKSATPTTDQTENQRTSKKDKARSDSATKSRSRSGSSKPRSTKSGSKKGSKHRSTNETTGLSDIPTTDPTPNTPSSPKPGEEGWRYTEAPILQESATFLMQFYENSEIVYTRNIKAVFRSLRQLRWLIIPHLYDAKTSFQNYLQRPDSKQPYVTQLQTSFNAISDDLRADEETKADLHCRTDDMRDNLYEIMDEVKAANETKVQVYLNPSGWLTSRMHLIVNLYLALMQIELARFQDHMRILKDYYSSVEQRPQTFENEPMEILNGTIDPNSAEYNRIPLVQLAEDPVQCDENPIATPSSSGSHTNSGSQSRGRSEGQSRKRSPNSHTRSRTSTASLSAHVCPLDEAISALPLGFATETTLLSSNSSLGEIHAALTKSGPGTIKTAAAPAPPAASNAKGGSKGAAAAKSAAVQEKQPLPNPASLSVDKWIAPTEENAQFLFNVCLCALQIVVNQYQTQRNVLIAEEEADGFLVRTTSTPKESKGKRDANADKAAGSKGRKKTATPRGRPAKGEVPATASAELSDAEQVARNLRHQIRKEQMSGLEKQASATIFRLTLIRAQACAVLSEMKQEIKQTKESMVDAIGRRTLREYEAVSSLIEVIRHAIEMEQKLPDPLILDGDQFYIGKNEPAEELGAEIVNDTLVSPSTKSQYDDYLGYFTILQLKSLLRQFVELAPYGYITSSAFGSILRPILEQRMIELSGPLSPDLINELQARLAKLYRSLSEMDQEPQLPPQVTPSKITTCSKDSLPAVEAPVPTPPVFYVDWRRFLLAATQGPQLFNSSAAPNESNLIDLAKRLFELSQHPDKPNGDDTMIGIKVSRTNFKSAKFPWYPTDLEYYGQLHDFIFSLFAVNKENELHSARGDETEKALTASPSVVKEKPDLTQRTVSPPTSNASPQESLPDTPKLAQNLDQDLNEEHYLDQNLECSELLLHLSTINAPNPFTGLLRSMAVLIRAHVPHYSIMGHETETQTFPESEGVPEDPGDPLIPKSVVDKVLNFGLINPGKISGRSSPEPQVSDAVQPGASVYAGKLTEIYNELRGDVTEDPVLEVPFSRLFEHPELVALLLNALPKFQLPSIPEPWPTLIRMHTRPLTASTSTTYQSPTPRDEQ